MKLKLSNRQVTSPLEWRVSGMGFVKVNFDGAKIGEEGHGLGMVMRDHMGSILMARVL